MAAIETLKEHKTQKDNKLMVGSLDVKALYPSLHIPFAAKKIAEEFIESKIEFEKDSIDTFQLGLYLVLTFTEEELITEGLRDFCPRRINTLGRKPTITGQAYANTEKKDNIWNPPKHTNPSEITTKKMIAKALEAGIKAVMKTHVYKFAGETRVQKQGGAIGLELTGEIAGVFMAWWDKKMKNELEEESVRFVAYKR